MVRGWLNVGVAFVTNFLSMGFAFYAFGVVLESISQEFPSTGRLGASIIPTLVGVSFAFSAPLIGKWIQNGSLKLIMPAGCLIGGAGYLLSSFALEIWHIYVIFATLVGVSAQMMGGVAANTLIVNWFEKNRPLVLGISMLGLSASGAIMPHIATWVGENGGWRAIVWTFGWSLIVAAPLIWFSVVDNPEQHGLGVDGMSARPARKPAAHHPMALRRIYADPVLWTVGLPVGLAFMGSSAVLLHSFAFAKDLGLADARAAWFITAVAVGAAGGKLLFGWLANRIGSMQAFSLSLVLQFLGFVGLVLVSGELPLIGSVFVVGLGFGGAPTLLASMLADLYGRDRFAPVMGAVFPMFTIFQGGGAPLAGFMHDRYGSYEPAFWIFAAAMLVAWVLARRIPAKHPNPAFGYV